MITHSGQLESFLTQGEALLDHAQSVFERAEVRIRSTIRIDMVLGSHLTRCILSTRNVFGLARNGDYFDASTVCRSVVEHATSVIYLSQQEDLLRVCDNFAMDGLSHTMGLYSALRKHYSELSVSSEDEERAKAIKELLSAIQYETRFMSQVADIQAKHPASAFSYLADVIYPDLSVFVHPRAHGLDELAPEPRSCYRVIRPKAHTHNGISAFIALALTIGVAGIVSDCWGLPFAKDLHERLGEVCGRHPDMGSGLSLNDFALPELGFHTVAASPKSKKATRRQRSRS